MEAELVGFISALRRAGLPVSSDETLAAAESIRILGFDNRRQLKSALSLVLAKTEPDKQRFSECFERFYNTGATQGVEANPQVETRRQEDQPPQAIADPGLTPSLSNLLQASHEQLRLSVQQAGENAGVEDIRLFTQRGVFLRRILQQLDWPELQQKMLDASQGAPGRHPRLADMQNLSANIQALARDYIDRQYALHGQPRSAQMREQMLMQTRINQLDPGQIASCRKLVARIVKRLTRHFKRRKRYYRRGMLDLHTTLRHNMSNEGILFKLRWRRKHRDRPRVFVLCDVSGSVRQYAELMLLFVYSLQDILPRAQCYAFASRLENITALLKARGDIEQAIATTLRRIGGGATDYASALDDFCREAGPMLNRNSVLIVFGDARNNHGDPSLDTFHRLTGKAGSTYWLNPESHFLWNTGDSVIADYARDCDGLFEASTLEQLEQFCEYLLRKTL